jgi:nucleotide-binding universal stress UspA family protein
MSQPSSEFYFQKIFHPSDFSEASNVAFFHALKLAVSTKGALSILHMGSGGGDWSEFPRARRTLERWEMLPPNSPQEAIVSLGLDIVKVASPHTDPVSGILRYLARHPQDLIVLATHQRDGFDRLTHRQVAEPVARRSGEITLFIPQGVDGFVSIESGAASLRHVLIPIDHAPNPQAAVDGAASIAHAFECHGTTFTLLYIGDEERFPTVAQPARDLWHWQRIVKQGPVEPQILQTADEIRADLIVMATAGHDGFLDAFRGSTTERIVRNSKCPILTVPAQVNDQSSIQEPVVWRPAV